MIPTPAQTGGGGPAAGHPRRPDRSLTVGDLTAHPSITIAPDEPAEHAVRRMHNCRVKLRLWLRTVARKLPFFAPVPAAGVTILAQCRWLVTPARAKCRPYPWPGTLVPILPQAEYLG